jgi:hypothetical protein
MTTYMIPTVCLIILLCTAVYTAHQQDKLSATETILDGLIQAATSTVATTTDLYVASSTPLPQISLESVIWQDSSDASITCFYSRDNTCEVSITQFLADLALLRDMQTKQVYIGAGNVVVPVGSGSSTDLITVLNEMEAQINEK